MSRRPISKLSPVTTSPHSPASSVAFQKDSTVLWSPKNGMTAMRHVSQPKLKSKRKPVLPGGKLQPIFRNDAASPKSKTVQNSEHLPVLPQISCDIANGGSELNVFSGALTSLPEAEPTDIRIYLCYCLTEMKAEVDALLTKALPQLQSFCADLGLSFQLVDPNWRERKSPEGPRYRSNQPNRILAECQQSSIGPNFVLLMGETTGQPVIVSEMTSTEFETLDDVISRNHVANGHLLTGCYVRDDNCDPPAFKIKMSPEAEPGDLIQLLQLASIAARDEGKLTDDAIKKYFTSALEEDVTNGVIRIQGPRTSCLGYRREIQTQNDKAHVKGQLKGEVIGQVTDDDESQGCAQSLWKNVEKYLSSTNSRNYFVKADEGGDAANGVGGDKAGCDGFRSYLEKLCADFVADVKDLILQSVQKRLVRSLESQVQLEALHHSRICERKSRSFHGQRALLEEIQTFLRDPSRNSQPFIIHGQSGSGKSAAVAGAVRTCREWFSGDCVTVVRFLGTTVATSSIHDTVTGIVGQICLAYGLEITEGFETLYESLSKFRATLEDVSKNHAHTRPLVIFLDGIDQLRPYSECLEALCAVKNLPPNVHMVLSSVKEYGGADFFGALATLLTGPECMAEVKALGNEDASWLVLEHLRGKGRKLSDDQLKAILSAATDVGNLPLYLNVIVDEEAARWESTLSDPLLPSTVSDALSSVLDNLEKEFGDNFVRYFSSYITVSQVGVIFEEMVDLLSSNEQVLQELFSVGIISAEGAQTFPVAMVMALKHRLGEFVEARLVFGRQGFGWSHREFQKAAAERYGIIVDGAAEEQLQEDEANFTLMLHEHFANIYVAKEDRSNRLSDPTLESSTGHGKIRESASALLLSIDDAFRSNRIGHHMRVLLPIEGLARVKRCLIFNFKWLRSRLVSSGLTYTLLRDVLSIHNLSRHLIDESVIDDTCADIEVVYEFLQLTLRYISKGPEVLAIEVLSRLRGASKLHPGVAQLVLQAEEWLQTTDRRLLVPLSSVWTQPGRLVRHTLPGSTHFLGYLREGEVAVMFSEGHGIDVWRLQTGELLHRFAICKEQTMEGILTGNSAEFVILTRYSHVSRLTVVDVWSTETGILLISSSFQREFEAVALDSDDQLMAVASLLQSEDAKKDLERCILGIAILTKDVVFRLPVGDQLHAEGVGKLIFVRNIKRETNSIVSFGRAPSQDLGFWDLDTGALDFSLDLGCTPSHVRLNPDHKVIVCGSSVTGTIVIVNLARGTINQKIDGDDYKDLTDIVTKGDDIFVAHPKNGVTILSVSQSSNRRVVNADAPNQAVPTKLLVTAGVNGEGLLFVGYNTGSICVFDLSAPDAALLGTLKGGHGSRVNSLSITRRGQLLSAAEEGSALVWNYQSLLNEVPEDVGGDADAVLARERGMVDAGNDDDDVRCFVVTSDEQRVITGSWSGCVQIWDIKSGELMKTMVGAGDNGIDHLSLARNDQLLIGHCTLEQLPSVHVLRVWDLEKSEVVPMEGEGDHVTIYCSAVTPSGDRLVTIRPCTDKGQKGIVLAIYDLTKMKSLSNLICNIYGSMDTRNLRIIGFSSRSPRQADTMATDDDVAKRKSTIDAADDRGTSGEKNCFLVLDYFPKVDISFFFTFRISSGDGKEEICMDNHDPFRVDTANPECSAVGPDEVCVTGSTGGRLVRWNTRSQVVEGDFVDMSLTKRKKEEVALAHVGPVVCVEVNFRKGVVVSGGGTDHKVKVWSLSSRELMTSFAGHRASILSVSFCAAHSLVVSTSADDTLCILKLAGKSAEKLCSFPTHGEVRSVVMTTDKQRVVSLLGTEAGSRLLMLRSINF